MRIGAYTIVFAVAALLAGGTARQRRPAQTPLAARRSMTAYQLILANPKVIKTLEDIKADDARRSRNSGASPKSRRRRSRRTSGRNII